MTETLSHGVRPAPNAFCAREGCPRRNGGDGFCSVLCMEIDTRLTRTKALISEKGITPLAAALWAAAVCLSDQLSEVNRLENSLTSADAVG